MQIKLFEVRDRATFIACFGVLMVPTAKGVGVDIAQEAFLLARSGFDFGKPLVMFGRLTKPADASYDPFGHDSHGRTMQAAHLYVQEYWNELSSGSVIDVEWILQETTQCKVTERGR